jgi:hypothetical protein
MKDEELIPGYIYSEIRLQGNVQDLPQDLRNGMEWTIESFQYGRNGVIIGLRRLAMREELAGEQIPDEFLIYRDEVEAFYNPLTGKYDSVYPIRAAFLAEIEEGQPVVGSTITYVTFEDDEELEKHPAWIAHKENGYDDHPVDNYFITDKVIRLWLRTVKSMPSTDGMLRNTQR